MADYSKAGWCLEATYAALPACFYARLGPVPVRAPSWAVVNRSLATELGLDMDALTSDAGLAWLAGNRLPPGAVPLAQAYAGHQFGHFTMLGDGRALVLGEQVTPAGARVDVQLKGSGQTPYSRRGDGRAALGPMLREYLISEAMYALGIPTTRSLAVVATGEPVYRESVLPGAVLTRVAASHVRVGTFQYAAGCGVEGAVRVLADYVIQRHFPACAQSPEPYRALLEQVVAGQASLVAQWMNVGFVHGVMNTDNVAVSGETIDYGPCAFLDGYDPRTVFSSIDRDGRYAFGNQPAIAQWNLARFAETLLPLLDPVHERAVESATEVLSGFPEQLNRFRMLGMRNKLGLFNEEADDFRLVEDLLCWMHEERLDYTRTFRRLPSSGPTPAAYAAASWYAAWRRRLERQPQLPAVVAAHMRQHNPAIIPRNHKVEEALTAATAGDYALFNRLLEALAEPYGPRAEFAEYEDAPPAHLPPYRTFCGT
jgi:serine/tyrosine/threonine adenylyltransferase